MPLALLEAVASFPGEAIHAGLARLQAAEFMYEAALFPEPEYTFKHALRLAFWLTQAEGLLASMG